MLLKPWLSLLAVTLLLSGCKSGPAVEFCVLDVPANVLRCAKPDGTPFDTEMAQADGFGCMAPEYWERILKEMAKSPAVKTALEPVKTQLEASEKTKAFLTKVYPPGEGPRPF